MLGWFWAVTTVHFFHWHSKRKIVIKCYTPKKHSLLEQISLSRVPWVKVRHTFESSCSELMSPVQSSRFELTSCPRTGMSVRFCFKNQQLQTAVLKASKAWKQSLASIWVNNKLLTTKFAAMTVAKARPKRNETCVELWVSIKDFLSNLMVCLWKSLWTRNSKRQQVTCPKLQILSFLFSGVDDLLDQAKNGQRENISSPIFSRQ